MRATGLAILLAASLSATLADASVITDSLLRDRLLGDWAARGDCSRGALSFKDDGTFSVTGDYTDVDFTGTFDVKDARLAGKTGDRTMPVIPLMFTDDGWLMLGPDQFMRCKAPPPAPATPARP
jgi:hypothetical protein